MAGVRRQVIAVEGIVQGVGFRPFVYREATSRSLRGFVRNDAGGVTIDVEGDELSLSEFLRALERCPPPLASIARIRSRAESPASYSRFEIVPSEAAAERTALVSPDVATCDACLGELLDPRDRRYRYPFINCTQCGPRLTIVRHLPYDRPHTSMAGFELCGPCRREYEDPRDRRFHAQPTACPDCGPRLAALDPGTGQRPADGAAALGLAVDALRAGRIVAVKGLGGYHLACDASDGAAVRRLRERKSREAKPLAVMVRDLEAAAELCHVDPAAAALLTAPARPIVLIPPRVGAKVAEEVAPGSGELGVMLPYTPVHHLLVRDAARPLVMTSGNRTDEPIVTDDAEAVAMLGSIADLILTHDRAIVTRCDDSVVRPMATGAALLRRSRGYVPEPVPLPRAIAAPVLAVGGHLKNTFCLARDDSAFLSHHVGDLETLAALRALERGIAHYGALFDVVPSIIAHDLHPDYLSTRLALERPAARRIAVQHHHAHVSACMAEHAEPGPVLGVAFDGTGLGTDGAIWGGEFLLVEGATFDRVGHLGYVPLPGGAGAIHRPDRMAAAHLHAAYDGRIENLPIPFAERFDPGEWSLIMGMLDKGVRSPPTSSVGRLFDAVSALAGIRRSARFEGEAAMALEWAADPDEASGYAFGVRDAAGPLVADPAPVIRAAVDDLAAGRPAGAVAARLHNGLARLVAEVALRVGRDRRIDAVALTGGVFQNRLLTERTAAALDAAGHRVLVHRRVPCNDGGLAYGQVAVAAATLDGSG